MNTTSDLFDQLVQARIVRDNAAKRFYATFEPFDPLPGSPEYYEAARLYSEAVANHDRLFRLCYPALFR